jgi:PmbA protein
MSNHDSVERALARLAQAGAADADVVLIEGDQVETRVRGDEIDFVQQAQTRTLGLRCFVEGDGGLRQASTSTSDLSAREVERMADETVALARATAVDPDAGLPEGGFATELPDLELFDPADRPWKIDEHIEAARSAERAAREVDPRITNSEGSEASCRFSEITYGNSRGFLGNYASASYGFYSAPLAEDSSGKQSEYWHSAARTLAGLEDAESVGRTAAERAVRRLGARPVPTCQAPVLFEGRVAGSLLGSLFGCLSGYALYRGSSFLADRLGDQIASEAVTVIDDGRLLGGLGSRPFDGEGLPTRRNVIVSCGRLQSYVFDTYSARKLGAESTGSATRAAGGGPGVGQTNLWLEPGALSPEELIVDTGRGLFVTELMGMGFNPVTGDYSRGAAGLWIENGEIAHPVQEVTIAGNLGDMLLAVDAVGNDLEWRGRVASPTLRIAQMTIAGV